jgi:TRAP-type mannitol/chloroaromatic compound transport system permease large subunit
VPGVPKEARTLRLGAVGQVPARHHPSAVLIFAVLGSMGGLPGIDTAIATPTEAGAMGVVGAMVLAAMHKRLSRGLIWEAMQGTMRLTAMVVFILIGARVFSMVFQGVDGGGSSTCSAPARRPDRLPDRGQRVHLLPGLLPRLLRDRLHHRAHAGPVADKLGIDLVWFGVLLA